MVHFAKAMDGVKDVVSQCKQLKMTKKEFFEKYFPFIYREEGQTFKEDIDKLVEDEIYAYCHAEDNLEHGTNDRGTNG